MCRLLRVFTVSAERMAGGSEANRTLRSAFCEAYAHDVELQQFITAIAGPFEGSQICIGCRRQSVHVRSPSRGQVVSRKLSKIDK